MKIIVFLFLIISLIFPILSPVYGQTADSLDPLPYLKYYLSGLDKSVSSVFDDRTKINFRYSPTLLHYNKSRLKKETEFVADPGLFVIKETVYGDILIRQPLVLTISEYLAMNRKHNTMENIFKESRKEIAREDRPVGGAGGLVPDIEMPLELKGKMFDWLYVWTPEERKRAAGTLRVTGYQKITFGGQSDWDNSPATETENKSKFPKLDMEQELKVHLSGKVGDKIEVLVDHDSKRSQLTKNTIRIRYEGDEDEIVQEIEAGNTNLSLGRSSSFIGSGFSHQGLFGIKSSLKIGGLGLTVIASKEESETKSKRFEGRAQRDTKTLRDYDYIKRRFYYVDQPQNLVNSNNLPKVDDPVNAPFTLWLDDNNGSNNAEQGAMKGNAYSSFLSFDPLTPDSTKEHWEGHFVKLVNGEDYYIDQDGLRIIQLNRQLRSGDILAIAYTREDGTVVGNGNPAEGDLVFRLLKPRNPLPDHPETWNCEAKNYYDFGVDQIEVERFTIYKIDPNSPNDSSNYFQQSDGREFKNILGLDKDGDGIVDEDLNADFYRHGILQFPLVMRDAEGNIIPGIVPNSFAFEGLDDPNPTIYNETHLDTEDAKYKLFVEYRSDVKRYNLGINIVEGSEVIKLGNETLKRGVDYDIIYETGTVTLRRDITGNENITIDYEYSPFMAQSQKTLMGFSAEYNLNSNTSLASSWVYRSEKTMEERPRIGNESTRYIVGDLAANFSLNPSIMTDMVNFLPFINTDRRSSVSFRGAAAISLPNPNIKGKAYIDDMEGIQKSSTIGIMRPGWVPASIPKPMAIADTTHMAKLRWYNPEDRIQTDEIFLQTKGTDEGDDRRHVLNIDFHEVPTDSSWGGLMRLVSNNGADYSELEYLEIWVNGDHGVLNFDIGSDINEDFRVTGVGRVIIDDVTKELGIRPSYGHLNTEDLNGDQKKDYDENVGIDGLPDGHEYDDGAGTPETNPNYHFGTDDYEYNPSSNAPDSIKYAKINGTEGNDDNILDTEDLDGNGRLDTKENFFRFSVDLSDTQYVIVDNSKEDPENGWRLFQIPIHNAHYKYGNPYLNDIRFFRMWLGGLSKNTNIRIASIEFVGNKWFKNNIRYTKNNTDVDSVMAEEEFDIIVKNNKEHPEYEPPKGVSIDKTDNDIEEREQSLGVRFSNLQEGHYASAYVNFSNKLDMMDYGAFSFYVNGYNKDNSNEEVDFFIRIGANSNQTDTVHFYEYRKTITLSKNVNWHEVDVDFPNWTTLKLEKPDSVNYWEDDTGTYAIKGNPTLTAITRITVGVASKNPGGINGEIWVDDIRTTKVHKKMGIALSTGANFNFADFLSFGLSLSWQDEEFTTLRGNSGSRTEKLTYGLNNVKLSLDQFFPSEWGINLPISGRYTKTISKPKLYVNSDIKLPEEESYKQRTESTSKELNLSYRKGKKSKNSLIGFLVDPISLNFKASQRESFSPTAIDSSVDYSAALSYNYTFGSHAFGIPLLGRFSYMPAKISFSSGYAEKKSTHYTISNDGTKHKSNREPSSIWDAKADVSYSPFKTISSSYSISSKNDRRYEGETEIAGFNLGIETNRNQKINFSYRPSLPSILASLKPNIAYSANYTEQNRVNNTTTDSISWSKDVTGNSTVNAGLTFDLRVITSELRTWMRIDQNTGGGSQKRQPRRRSDYEDGKAPAPFEELEEEEKKKDEDEEEPKKENQGGGSNAAGVVFGGFFDLVDRIAPLNTSYQLRKSNRYKNLSERPGWGYQFGLSDSIDVEGTFEEKSESSDYNVGSGVRIFSNLNINGDFKYSETKRWLPGTISNNYSQTWPSLSVNLNQLEQYPVIRLLFTSASVSSRYTVRTEWQENLGEGRTRETISSNWSPLLNLSATLFKKLRLDVGTNATKSEEKNFISDTRNERTTKNYSLKVDYSFSAKQGISIPIWGLRDNKIRFTSDVRLSVPFTYKETKNQVLSQSAPSEYRVEYSVNPSMSYDFSKSITGNLRGDYRKNEDKKSGTTRYTVRVHIGMNFKF